MNEFELIERFFARPLPSDAFVRRGAGDDCALLDVNMPVLDGFAATKKLRQQGLKTCVIALTANAMQGDRELCLEAGMDDYVSKPVTALALNEILEKYVQSEKVATVPAAEPKAPPAEVA